MTVAGGIMKRMLVVFVLLATAIAFAQDNKNPVTSVVKEILPRQQKNLVAAGAERGKMKKAAEAAMSAPFCPCGKK